jgi:hypothetical protein
MSNETLPVEFQEEQPSEVGVTLDDKAIKKAKQRERIAERVALEKLGVRAIKLRLTTYRLLKSEINKLGIKTIAHCTLITAREKAEQTLIELDTIAKEMDDAGPLVDVDKKMALRQLKLEIIKTIIDSGAEHIRAERQSTEQPSINNIQFPFPAGTPIAVAVGKVPGMIEEKIEELE